MPSIQVPAAKKNNASILALGLIVALIVFGSAFSLLTVVVAASPSPTFSSAINLSNDTAIAKDPTVSNNGQNVFVAWTEGGKGIHFRMSPDGGSTWMPQLFQTGMKLGPNGGAAAFPVMFTQFQQVNSGDVYLAWSQTVKQLNGSMIAQIFVAASSNNGQSFVTTQISQNSTHNQITPAIAASGNDVYVAWFSGQTSGENGSDYVASSKNNGVSWGVPVDFVPSERGGEVQVVAAGANVYVIGDGIFFTASYTNGDAWSQTIKLFTAPPRTSTSFYYGREPWIAASGNLVYATWEANSTTSGISYHDQSVTSTDGGKTWGPAQNVTDPLKDNWEPENAAFGNNLFLTFHSLNNQGVYVASATNVNSNSPTWSSSKLLSPTGARVSLGMSLHQTELTSS